MTLCGQFITGICWKKSLPRLFSYRSFTVHTQYWSLSECTGMLPNFLPKPKLITFCTFLKQTYTILKIQLKNQKTNKSKQIQNQTHFKRPIFYYKESSLALILCLSLQLFNSYNSCIVFTTEDLYTCDLHQDNRYILLWAIIPVSGIFLQH